MNIEQLRKDMETGGPAFPRDGVYGSDGMTLREYAAIKLRVPDSGTDWLDDMIRKAKRDDFAGQAMEKFMFHDSEIGADQSYSIANAMLAAGGAE